MTNLPVVATPEGHVVEDPDTGEAVRVEDASDHALALAPTRGPGYRTGGD
jgi:hypothetical protein